MATRPRVTVRIRPKVASPLGLVSPLSGEGGEPARRTFMNEIRVQREISHTIEIDASPAAVWRELADTGAYGHWNPFVRRLDGELAENERLEVEITPPEGRAMTFRPTVLAAKPGRELRWRGHLLVPGLFDGEHSFEIQPLEDDRVRFIQREAFKGLLVPLFAQSLESNTRRGFEEMNHALKERAEAAPREQD